MFKRMGIRVKSITIIGLAISCVCLIAGGLGLHFYRYAVSPIQTSETSAVVWITSGQSFSGTVAQLQERGLVRHPQKFRWLAWLRGDERHIRAGEYVLRPSMSPNAILDTLVSGEVLLHKVVIPEGSTLFHIGRILERAGLMSQEAFLDAAEDPRLVDDLGLKGNTSEGYLFPETYHDG
jgi:UPF0755 protein